MSAHTTYQKFAQFYDAYVQDFEGDLELYTSLCTPEDRILEIGCGTGRVLKHLLEHGLSITGVDISQDMLDVAQEKLHTFLENGRLELVNHNVQESALPVQYDKVLITFYTFNYILEQPETFLQHVAMSMVPGGVVLMDLFYPHTLLHPEHDDVWREKAWHFQHRVIHLKDKRTVRENVEERIQVYQEGDEEMEITTRRKYYAPEEMIQLLRAAGFQNIELCPEYEAEHFQPDLQSDQFRHNFLVKAVKP
jgi:ubiquinone/menaquinone biosynthesis C-methylase UbiE